MSSSPSKLESGSSSALPVLHLDGSIVELAWMHAGVIRYETAAAEDPGNRALVEAARSLIAGARLRRRGLVLVLADSFFDSRQVLLGKLPDEEAAAVLERKAANALGIDKQECLYWARRCETPLAGATNSQSTWLVHTRRRSEHFDLLLRLRQAGIQVARTVAGRDVLTGILGDVTGEVGNILITSTGRALFAQLFRGDELVQESRLPLESFEERQETYTGIVQDVRQLTAFWSKGSRGAGLAAISLFGFTELEVDEMRGSLSIAAQGAEIQIIGAPATAAYADVRKRLMGLFITHSQRSADLKIPLPARPSRILSAALGLALVSGAATWKLVERLSARNDRQTAEIAAQLAGTETLDTDEAQRQAYLNAREALETSIESLGHLPRRGLPLEALLAEVYGTLGRVVEVKHLAFKEGEKGPTILLEASLPDEAESAAEQLERLRRGVQSDRKFEDVVIQPSSHVPRLDQGESLTFTFTGTFKGGDA